MKNINDYDLKIRRGINMLSFKDNASKLTKMSLKLISSGLFFTDTFTIAYPNKHLNILPFISFLYSQNFKKDVLVITPNKYQDDLDKFQDIQIGNDNLYKWILPFTKSLNRNNFLEIAFSESVDKEELLEDQDYNTPHKIIFSSDLSDLEINRVESKKYVGKKELSLKELSVEVGLVIIENVDRFLFSEIYYLSLTKMIKELTHKHIKILIHFSNPYSEYISRLNKDLKNLVLLYDSSFFINNKKELYNPSWDKGYADDFCIYELDNPSNYELDYNISPPIESGNLDYYFAEYQRIKKQNWAQLKEYWDLIGAIDSRFKEMYNLAIHPSGYTFGAYVNKKFIPNCSIKEFILEVNTFSETLPEETSEIISYLLYLMNSFFLELKESKRYFDKTSYNAICKNLIILDMLKLDDISENVQNKYTILIKNNYEKRKLITDIKNLRLKYLYLDNIHIITFNQLVDSDKESLLIVPGCLDSLNQLIVLFNMFTKVIFLTYKGINEETLELHIKEYKKYCSSSSSELYFDKLFTALKKIIPENIIPEYLKPKVCIPIELPQIVKVEENPPQVESKEKKEFKIIFKELVSNKKISRTYIKDQRLLAFNEESTYDLKKVKYLKVGNIVLDIEGNRNVLDILSDLYGLSNIVDIGTIKEYYQALINYVDEKGITLESFYEEYVKYAEKPKQIQELKLWINQGVIGPESPQDIEALGKAMNNEEVVIQSQYIFDEIEKVRNNHILAGRKLKKIINKVISKKEIEVSSFDEYAILNAFPLYEVKEIKRFK